MENKALNIAMDSVVMSLEKQGVEPYIQLLGYKRYGAIFHQEANGKQSVSV